jgi:hypothetical protein
MRKLLYTFSLIAVLLCAAAPSALARNANRNFSRNFNSRQSQSNFRQPQFGNRFGNSYGQRRQQRQPYGNSYGQYRQQRQFGNQYRQQGQEFRPNGRYGHGDIRDYGHDHYYGNNFIVTREYDNWGGYGYPYPYLFGDCYQGNWIYQPRNGSWFVNVWFNGRIVTAYWDPYLGGYYYYYDPYMDSK